jgi:putative SOS response-associated peptidase YedK
MCGRFALKMLDGFLLEHPWILPPAVVPGGAGDPRYNIAPSQPVAAVIGGEGAKGDAHVEYVKWGLVPSWATDPAVGNKMINARAETLAERPAFRRLLAGRRCLVVADGFYEWKKVGRGKVPYYVRLRSGKPFAMAGLWDQWRDPDTGEAVKTCTIITAEPNELVAGLHHRMAVIVRPTAYRRWLGAGTLSTEESAAVFRPYGAEEMEAWPVSAAVNHVGAQGVELTQRVEVPAAESQGMLF